MKRVYPVIFTQLFDEKDTVLIEVPDLGILTEGFGMADAVEMARDAIGLMGIDMEDENKEIPAPSPIDKIKVNSGEILSLVDVDFTEYRRKNDVKFVRKNCTIPNWLCLEAERANINFSALLQKALKSELNV